MKRFAFLFALGLVGCTTAPVSAPNSTGPVLEGHHPDNQGVSLSRESSNAETAQLKKVVKVTGDPAEVAGCRAVGQVGEGGRSYSVSQPTGIWYYDPPRSDTKKLGGNTLLTTDGIHGTAYACPGSEKP